MDEFETEREMGNRRVHRRVADWLAVITLVAAVAAIVANGARARPASGPLTYVGVVYDTAALSSNVFYISGDANGLYPGRTTSLPLTVTNPNTSLISVTSLTVAVTGTDVPGCDASGTNLATAGYSGPPFTVPANDGTATVSVPISMPTSVVDACRNATFALAYGGSATQVAATPGSKAITIGPYGQGRLSFAPGSWIATGFQLKLYSRPFPIAVDVTDASVTVPVRCANGSVAAGSPLTIRFPDQHLTVPAGWTGWYPVRSRRSYLDYQAAVQFPAMCSGISSGTLQTRGGSFFTALVSTSDTPIKLRYHSVIPSGIGGANLDCSSAAANPGDGIPDCIAGWSSRVDP
ncbi:MAG: hypothetical protein ACJ77A_04250 [Actinomycetota bacterium]